jgi:protein O-mannosyl-transferase
MSRAGYWHVGAMLVVAIATAILYVPFLGNPLVFDDRIFFSGYRFSYYATNPLGFDLRLPPYFTLAVTEVLWGGVLEAQRIVSLLLHVGVALALYWVLVEAQRAVLPPAVQDHVPLRAAIGAAAFALHPVAVYGAGYLVQRSIVMATLFALASLGFFLRGLRRGSHADALSAALLYWLAVLSKEHAILLPAVALPLLLLLRSEPGFALRHAALYLAACAPAAVFVALMSLGIIGGAYEQAAGAIAAQVASATGESPTEPSLALSAATQAGLYFRYLFLWLWPDPSGMAIDLRVDFAAGWSLGWIFVKVAGYVAAGALGVVLLLRRGAPGLAGFGLVYAWILYVVEFSAVRFQEPFVLYRSYLWGPGLAAIVVAVLSHLPRPGMLAAGALGCAALTYVAHDRLVTFSSPLRLWVDAAAKLPATAVPLGSRVLYHAGREYLYAGQPGRALEVITRCMREYPEDPQCIYARGAAHLHLRQFAEALPFLRRSIELQPGAGILHHRLGLALEGLDRLDEAQAAYRRALELGFTGAQMELERLERADRRGK